MFIPLIRNCKTAIKLTNSYHGKSFAGCYTQQSTNGYCYSTKPVTLASKSFQPYAKSNVTLSPIILLHGMTASKEEWDDIAQNIANRAERKVFAFDARNHGDSEFTDEYNFELNVEDLFHTMDTMGIKEAALVGHSMGAHTATNAALHKPDRVEAIFSEDMYVRRMPKMLCDQIHNYIDAFSKTVHTIPKQLNPSEHVKFVVDAIVGDNPKLLDMKKSMYKVKHVFKHLSDGSYDISFNKSAILRSLKDYENLMKKPKGQFDGTAIFMYGTKSAFMVSSEEDHIRQHFPNAKLVEFSGAFHDIHVDFPDQFVSTIAAFLKHFVM